MQAFEAEKVIKIAEISLSQHMCLLILLRCTSLMNPFPAFTFGLVVWGQVDEQGDLWQSLEKVSLPVVLNLSQCKLELKQYQRVVELNSQLLEKHKGRICSSKQIIFFF